MPLRVIMDFTSSFYQWFLCSVVYLFTLSTLACSKGTVLDYATPY